MDPGGLLVPWVAVTWPVVNQSGGVMRFGGGNVIGYKPFGNPATHLSYWCAPEHLWGAKNSLEARGRTEMLGVEPATKSRGGARQSMRR